MPDITRYARQAKIADWVMECFGEQHMGVEERAARLLEEAIEAAQAAGVQADAMHKLVDYVNARPAGSLTQEIGGVSITLLALAQSIGVSADELEERELARVLSRPIAAWKKRHKVKTEAGIAL